MNGAQVRTARKARGLNQADVARRLGVSQGYVSLLERNHRSVPVALAPKLASLLDMPARLVPVRAGAALRAADARRQLGTLGYPGFEYLESRRRLNPAEVLLRTLRADVLDARVVSALPWLLVQYPDLKWEWVVREAKQDDLQNRLGFVVSLARALAEAQGQTHAVNTLSQWEHRLEASRLLKTDALSSATEAEERWLRHHRSPEARRWNVLSTLTAESVVNAS